MTTYRARWVVPISSAPIEEGAIAVRDGVISFVGAGSDAPDDGGDTLDFGDAILLPGLVNAHTHLELTVMRGFLEETDFCAWIDKLRVARYNVLTDDMLLDSARHGIEEGLLAGVTTFADTCSSGVVMQAMSEAGVRGIMFQEVFGPAPDRGPQAMAQLRESVDRHRSLESELLAVGVSPHAPYTVSDDLYRETASFASENRLPLAAHIAESGAEMSLVCEGGGAFAERLGARGIAAPVRARSPIALLESLGMLRDSTLLIHCVTADDCDLDAIAAGGSAVAHCPISNAKLAHGVAPVASMLERGIRVGLGSDSMASNNRMHMLEEARHAVLHSRVRDGPRSVLTSDVALEMATLGGARALGMADRTGSLEEGKEADFAVFPLSEADAVAVGGAAAAAIFSLGGSKASFVAVRGRPLVRDGALVRCDPALSGRVAAAAHALRDSTLAPSTN